MPFLDPFHKEKTKLYAPQGDNERISFNYSKLISKYWTTLTTLSKFSNWFKGCCWNILLNYSLNQSVLWKLINSIDDVIHHVKGPSQGLISLHNGTLHKAGMQRAILSYLVISARSKQIFPLNLPSVLSGNLYSVLPGVLSCVLPGVLSSVLPGVALVFSP